MSRQDKKDEKSWITALKLVLVVLVVAGGFAVGLAKNTSRATAMQHPQAGAPVSALASADTAWSVGELRENGLRIIPIGSSDASAVLDLEQYTGKTRNAYWIATQIPEVLNQLYCWCGCENRGVHRSTLGCFEDRMGENCDVCQGTAEIAYEMVQKGITDAGKNQAAVDAKWAPKG
ncbi:hypothetical protein BH23GEM5_BH23GEM5_20390 [soil metagenome]